MSAPTLIFDVSYLAHRALHSVGGLAHGGEGTGVVFGLLRDVLTIQETFGGGRCVFAFDHPAPKHRRSECPGYKSTRRARYRDEAEADKERRRGMARQLRMLYKEHLPAAGFRNVFAAAGYEADDIIARVVAGLVVGEDAIIVASDQDLWQCVRHNPSVSCWNPQTRKLVNFAGFVEQWGFAPPVWADVKAIAGCKTDDVPGVPGVGELTAAKYLRGELKPHLKAHAAIEDNRDLWYGNLPVVKLPYHGTPHFELRADEVTEDRWRAVLDGLGINSLPGLPRGASRRKGGRPPKPRGGFFK